MFAWLSGIEQCVCSHAQDRGTVWDTNLEINDSFPAVPGFKDSLVLQSTEYPETLPRLRGKLPPGPRLRSVPTFRASESETMHGEPLLLGTLMHIKLEESVQQMTVTLYANGFSMSPMAGGSDTKRVNRAWSPFSLVEKCQVKTLQHSAYWAVFKLTVFRSGGHDLCLYFACTGGNAYKERDRWVEKIGSLCGEVTRSLFPPAAEIKVQPLPGIESTSTRILAGFLLQGCNMDTCQLVYAELHAYVAGEAKLTLYRDEWCDRELSTIILSNASTVSTRSGVHCNVFGIDHHRFCARDADEKELWLRAVSNVKVKLMFEAPDPTPEELWIFRHSVQERIALLDGTRATQTTEALLLEVTNRPPVSPNGDSVDPDPIEDPHPEGPTPKAEAFRQGGGSGDVAAGPANASNPPAPAQVHTLKVPEPAEGDLSEGPAAEAVDAKEVAAEQTDEQLHPGEGSVAARVPRARAAPRRLKDVATHEATLRTNTTEEVEEPDVAAESLQAHPCLGDLLVRDGRILEGVGRNSIDSRINGALSASSVGFKLQNPISRTPKAICCPFENAEGLFTSRRRCSVGGQLTDNSLPQPEPGLARHKVAANTKQHNFFPHFLLPFAKVADHFSDV
ncbi:Caltractin [Symbiodinium natans]|uniref:Caltractin protein n=1 Tax=Symbiodinium natans TaxID=878477 RepID=A0A812SNY9_9DINO|nr:Caltractin [Symbiodinium natans]